MNTKNTESQGFFMPVLFGLCTFFCLSAVLLLLISAVLLATNEPEKLFAPLGIFVSFASALACGIISARLSKSITAPLVSGGIMVLTVLLLSAAVPVDATLSPLIFTVCCILLGLTPLAGGLLSLLREAKKPKRKRTRRGR